MTRLEPIAMRHAGALQPLLEHPAVAEATPFPHPYPADGAHVYVHGLVTAREAGSRHDFAILDDAGAVAGVVLVKDIDRQLGRGELGYWLGVPYWGKGHATAAGTAAVEYAFGALGLSVLTAGCLATNHGSLRVLAKLGFTEVGREPWALPKWPEPRECIILELHREGWDAR